MQNVLASEEGSELQETEMGLVPSPGASLWLKLYFSEKGQQKESPSPSPEWGKLTALPGAS